MNPQEDSSNNPRRQRRPNNMSNEKSRPVTLEGLRQELKHYATKADLSQMEARLVKWLAGIVLGSAGLAIAALGLLMAWMN